MSSANAWLICSFQSSLSYNLILNSTNLQTLSSNSASKGSDVEGLLYVPTLLDTDPCFNRSKQFVPENVVTRAKLPDVDYSLIAHAPWISANCTKSYLASASQDGARAFFFFDPDHSLNQPRAPNDPFWGLNDGGQWKSQNKYPVYALSGFYGQEILHELALYSGNMTDVPHGDALTETYDPRDYVRLYTDVDTGHAPTSPSVWVFLLIVLALLLSVVFATSFLMHFFQRRRRQELRRLIADGEVDLEALGIKRVKVPQEVIDDMPMFIYVANGAEKVISKELQSPHTTSIPRISSDHYTSSSNGTWKGSTTNTPKDLSDHVQTTTVPSSQPLPHHKLVFAQETCPICLDDFNSHETVVRQLPCVHVYHPECIDPFLKNNSSLCPICKGKVLPKGYCPADITNAMVRRERLVRRMRERVVPPVDYARADPASSRPLSVGRRMASFHRQPSRAGRDGRRISSAPVASSIEMRQTEAVVSEPPGHLYAATASARSAIGSRTERARRRVSVLLGHQIMAENDDLEREARMPRCKFSYASYS